MSKELVRLATKVDLSYNEGQKATFHRLGKMVLRKLAAAMNLPKGSFDVRSNLGGIAVSGEVTLHGESIYVDLQQSSLGADMGFMVRSCNGRKDYTGGQNIWLKWDELLDLPKLAEKLNRIASAPKVTAFHHQPSNTTRFVVD